MRANGTQKLERSYAALVAAALLLSLVVRGGTAFFLIEHIDDAGWFQYGSYAIFQQSAERILSGEEPAFFLTDPTRTDLVQYPPAFPMLLAAIYTATGDHSAAGIVKILWPLDALITPLLLLGIGTFGFGRRVGISAAFLGALAPMLAIYGVTPTTDPFASWFVLGAFLLTLHAFKKRSWRIAACAGLILGISCWMRVNPLFLCIAWGAVLPFAAWPDPRRALPLSLALIAVTFTVVAPVTVRNYMVYNEFLLNGLSVGTNLWEGLGETEFGRENGFLFGDDLMIESERAEFGYPPDAGFSAVWPDGIRRDRERARKSLGFISQHPVWYAGVMATRAWYMVKIAGAPGKYYGGAGFNCTPSKCLPDNLRFVPVTWSVGLLGAVQSVYRYAAMPLAVLGLIFAFRRNRAAALLILITVIYYLVPGTFAHTELRYLLPMHAILVVASSLGAVELWNVIAAKRAAFGKGGIALA